MHLAHGFAAMLTTQHFTITNIIGRYSVGGGLSPRPVQWIGVEAMDVECIDCRYAWVSLQIGAGHFDETVSGVTLVTCPGCGSTEPVSNKLLQIECER